MCLKGLNTTDGRKWDKKKVLENIRDNYKKLEESIVKQLFFDLHNSGITLGTLREDIWKSFFEQIVPKKFKVERSVFIIDSNLADNSTSGISKEVDIAIFDESYTPYIFQYGRIKFIPIEAVAAVVECKSTSRNKKELTDWVNSIKELKTCTDSIARMAQIISFEPPKTQTATRPIMINCYLSKNKNEGKQAEEIDNLFDFVLNADEDNCKIHIKTGKNMKLDKLFFKLNHARLNDNNLNILDFRRNKAYYETDEEYCEYMQKLKKTMEKTLENYSVKEKNGEEVSLLSFNFMFNQSLMLINNPILFPHIAYVKMFNNISNDKDVEGKNNEK